jgi:2-amino-4-hydroxy-6-hydroxymethyldihydropteridine diphosphokinase
MATAYLGLGANLGDPAAQIRTAISLIDGAPAVRVTNRSKIIISPPWGNVEQNDFHNAVIEVETELDALSLLELCLRIERDMGRVRIAHWGPRTIDIDIIAFGRDILKSQRLTIPHPFAHQRPFVMDPLREIAPDVADWIYSVAPGD